jgi:hypothetical protein
VQFVAANSPAALTGIRFGDQILQIDGKDVVGLSGDAAMQLLNKGSKDGILLAVRDRWVCCGCYCYCCCYYCFVVGGFATTAGLTFYIGCFFVTAELLLMHFVARLRVV